jgi:hypothetical protein
MERPDAKEATGVVQRTLDNLLKIIPNKGVDGAIARARIGDVRAQAYLLLRNDALGPPLDECFDLVRQNGATWPQMEGVRAQLMLEAPQTLGATLTRDYSIQLALAQQGKIIAATTFTSRQDVDQLIAQIQLPFQDAEEIAADTMDDPMTYRELVRLHAAIVNHLVQTALPLPLMLTYQFASTLPSIIISHKLYADASRYDEIRKQNKIVHPAFCPLIGQALAE